MAITLKEAFRIAVGAIRPELRKVAQWIVDQLPPALRQEWLGRIMGALAQIVERTEILGIQESISDAIEIISDEIGKKVRRKAQPEEIDELKETKKILENALERLKQAENVEDEKNRIIAELQAYEAILEIFKTIEEKYVPKEEKKIDWAKIGEKLKEIIKVINEQGIQKAIEFIKEKYPEAKEEIIRQRDEFLRGFKEGWQKGRKKGLI
jgi:flagellar biosynthesis/type III secretory pathway chaperone